MISSRKNRNGGVMGYKDKPKFIAGTFLVSYLLFGTRWISHISIFGFYLTDLILLCTIAWVFVKAKQITSSNYYKFPAFWALIVFLTYCFAVFVAGSNYSRDSLRDVAPYAYSIIGVIGFLSILSSTQRQKQNSFKVIYIALALHALWLSLTIWVPNTSSTFPLVIGNSELHYFESRPDIDLTLLGMLVALNILISAKSNWRQWFALLVANTFLVFTMLQMTTRGGWLGSLSAMALVIVLSFKMFITKNSRVKVFTLLGALTALLLSFGISSPALERASGTLNVVQTFSGEAANSSNYIEETKSDKDLIETPQQLSTLQSSSSGTTQARISAWNKIVNWLSEHPSKLPTGVGFGPNFMIQTGAGEALLGINDPRISEVRSPHNYLLGTTMRIGIIGIVILISILVLFVRALYLYLKSNKQDNLFVTASIIVPGLLAPALVGVILESPFGAIPFWWAMGIVLAYSNKSRLNDFESYESVSTPRT